MGHLEVWQQERATVLVPLGEAMSYEYRIVIGNQRQQ